MVRYEYIVKVNDATYYMDGTDVKHVDGFTIIWRYDECMAVIKDEELKYIINCGAMCESCRCEDE